MTGDDMLFGGDEQETSQTGPTTALVARWQIDQVRSALDGLGLVSMVDRQLVVEGIVGRPVGALSELNYEDVRLLLEGIHERKPQTDPTGSTWDHRDKDTWIDRL